MEFITQNGHKNIKITPASFQNAVKLKKALMKCLLDADLLKEIDNVQTVNTSGLPSIKREICRGYRLR